MNKNINIIDVNPNHINKTTHEWSYAETKIVCEMYINNKTPGEIKEKLPQIKLNSIKMKYANCIFLDKGDITGALNGATKLHKQIWNELNTKEPVQNINIINNDTADVIARNRRTNIPQVHRSVIWNEYVGVRVGQTECLCCNEHLISQLHFHIGHIIPRSIGGNMSKENLRPICSQCNLSMGCY
jgi:hypothetical protein